ncbi:MAG: hypothetical protein HN341_04450 [Verrucomicrobia bacterium]|jgi:hypothetical protein|nr:hypothetical protein [Verrucomicrobiota bacterium]
MSRRFTTGLILIGVSILILLLNTHGKVDISFVLFEIRILKSVAFLFFLGVGVFIGALLR